MTLYLTIQAKEHPLQLAVNAILSSFCFSGSLAFILLKVNEALSSPCKVNLKHSDTHLQLYGKHYHLQLQHEDSKCFQLQPKKVASKQMTVLQEQKCYTKAEILPFATYNIKRAMFPASSKKVKSTQLTVLQAQKYYVCTTE